MNKTRNPKNYRKEEPVEEKLQKEVSVPLQYFFAAEMALFNNEKIIARGQDKRIESLQEEEIVAEVMKTVIRLINLGGKGSQETASKIREVIETQWKDKIIEGSDEGSADYDIAIVFGGDLPRVVVTAKDGTRIEGDDLEDLIERGLKLAFDKKIQSRVASTPRN